MINIGVQKIVNGPIQIFYGLIALDMFSKFMINPNIIVAGIMFIFNVAAAFTVDFGVSRCLEGAQNIKNGADGRTDIVSINVYRDVIFQSSGNKELYDNIEFIALTLTILGIMTGPALNDYGYTHPTKPIDVTQSSFSLNSDGLPFINKVAGWTKHGTNQALGRDEGIGVSNDAIIDAVKNPTQTIIQPGGTLGDTTKYIGQNAVVVLMIQVKLLQQGL